MNWQRAPLYVDSHDLARWLGERLRTSPGDRLLARLADAAVDLLGEVACALSFPEDRLATIHRADRLVARLRVWSRLAVELGALTANQNRFVAASLDRVGRQLGGWSRANGRGLAMPAGASDLGSIPPIVMPSGVAP